MKYICISLSVVVLSATMYVRAYTTAETNRVVRGMLFHAMSYYNHDNFMNGNICVQGSSPDTWEGFLGQSRDGQWSFEERKNAFDWYLSTLGSIDCKALPWMDQAFVRTALSRCDVLNYTNAAVSIRALALNPQGVHRQKAIELYLKFAPTDEPTTTFVETIMTNVVGYSLRERGAACGIYGYRLCLFSPTNAVELATKTRAVEMFCRNRNVDCAAAHIFDMLLVSNVVNYAASSNRLDTLMNMLSYEKLNEKSRRGFINVTNQLLSSGQPLRQLNLGENE